jgi:T5SS/PEP-CTERM-associated repeat protein
MRLGGASGGTGLLNLDGSSSNLGSGGSIIIGANGVGTANVSGGADVAAAGTTIGQFTGSTGQLTISGTGSTWTNNGSMVIGASGLGSLSVLNGATISTTGLQLGSGSGSVGSLIVNGGGSLFQSLTGSVFVGGGSSAFGGSGYVSVGPGALLLVGSTSLIQIYHTGSVNLDGGAITTGSIAIESGGQFNFNSGSLLITGANGLSIGQGSPLGTSLALKPGQSLGAINSATITATGLVQTNGGDFSGGGLTNSGELQLIDRASNVTFGSVVNQGIITGNGRIAGTIANAATGQIIANPGDRISFINGLGFSSNSGRIDLFGGTVEYDQLNNSPTGRITGHGQFSTTSGLVNSGTVTLSGGDSDVLGSVITNATGKIIVTGNSTATFWNDVFNNSGSEFRVATGSTAVFLGSVTGLDAFTGLGIKDFEGPASFAALDTPGSTLVGTGGALVAGHIREAALEVDGVAQVIANGTNTGTSRVQTLTIPGSTNAWQGKLDLNDNDLVIDYSGASPLNTVANQIKSGRAGGAWNGNGITSSAAAVNPRTALGYGEASALGLSSFSGQSVDSTAVLVKYTFYGDADLDGDADGVDIGTWATNFTGELGGTGTKVWTQGDWDYDGDVDGVDAGLWAQSFTGELGGGGLGSIVVNDPTISPQAAAILRGMGITVVPEPAALLVISSTALLLLRRRRTVTSVLERHGASHC